MDSVIAFRDALEVELGQIDFIPVADGCIRRFRVPGDKPGSLNGAYQLHAEGIASGWYGTWKDAGKWHSWSSRKPIDPLEAELLRQRNEQARRQREVEQQRQHQEAADHASRLWGNSPPAVPDHPYLTAKGIKPHSLRQSDDVLLVPLIHDGHLVNLQRIYSDGSKRFLAGARVSGCYCLFGHIEAKAELYIVEGVATAATLHSQIGKPVTAAMSAHNLLPVGLELKRRYPDAVLVIGGDDDRAKQADGKPNVGKQAAIHAAAALGCSYVLPAWPQDAPLHLSDFNDLYLWQEGRL